MKPSDRCSVHPNVLGTATTTPALRLRVDASPNSQSPSPPVPSAPPSALDHLGHLVQTLLGAAVEDIYQPPQIARPHAELEMPP